MVRYGTLLGLVILLASATCARAEKDYPFCIDFQANSKLVYQLPRSVLARQPQWQVGGDLPVPLTKLCQVALDHAEDDSTLKGGKWRIEHVQFWRIAGPSQGGAYPIFQAGADIPPDLQDRWFCVIEVSCYQDYTGEWYKNHRDILLLLDGMVVAPTPKHP